MSKAAEPTVVYQGHASTPSLRSVAQHDGRGRTGKCFLVPADEIRANKYDLSISRYKQIEHKEIEYEKPEVIMKKVLDIEKAITKDVDEIDRLLR